MATSFEFVGRSTKSSVVVGDRSVTVAIPLLKAPLSIELHQIHAAVRVTEIADPDWVSRRNYRTFDANGGALDSNVLLVLSAPAHVGPFKYGAENGLNISRKDRKRGLDADVVGITVKEPDRLVGALAVNGVKEMSRNEALRSAFGVAMGDDLVRRRAEDRATFWKFAPRLALWSMAMAGMVAWQLALAGHVRRSTAFQVRAVVVAEVVMCVIALALVAFRRGGPKAPRPVRDRFGSALPFAVAPALVPLLLLFGGGWLFRQLDVAPEVADGIIGGALGGGVLGFAASSLRRRPT